MHTYTHSHTHTHTYTHTLAHSCTHTARSGPSYIIGLGDYKGGGLWVNDKGGIDVKEKVTQVAAAL
jgi:hypothetical protein